MSVLAPPAPPLIVSSSGTFSVASSILESSAAPNPGFVTEWGTPPDRSYGIATCVDEDTCGEAITLYGNTRAYLYSDFTVADDGFKHFQRFDLRGRTLRYTVDLSKVPCSAIAALYFVAGRTTDSSDVYCDMHTPEPCTEIDLFEANGMSTRRIELTTPGHATHHALCTRLKIPSPPHDRPLHTAAVTCCRSLCAADDRAHPRRRGRRRHL